MPVKMPSTELKLHVANLHKHWFLRAVFDLNNEYVEEHGKALLCVLEAAAEKKKKRIKKAKHQRAQIATVAQAVRISLKTVKKKEKKLKKNKLPHTYQLHVFVGSQL